MPRPFQVAQIGRFPVELLLAVFSGWLCGESKLSFSSVYCKRSSDITYPPPHKRAFLYTFLPFLLFLLCSLSVRASRVFSNVRPRKRPATNSRDCTVVSSCCSRFSAIDMIMAFKSPNTQA